MTTLEMSGRYDDAPDGPVDDPRIAVVEWERGCDDPGQSRAAGDVYEAQLWGRS